MLKVIKSKISIPVFVMIRPRGGDFLYTPLEYDVMHKDLTDLKQAGADGFVFGILTQLVKFDSVSLLLQCFNLFANNPEEEDFGKYRGNRRKCLILAFSPFPSIFSII